MWPHAGDAVLLAEDVAEAHWQHYGRREAAETIVGPGDMFKDMPACNPTTLALFGSETH